MNEVLLLITTEPNEKKAINIAKLLIKNKLAACVSIKPIHSIYRWEDDIEEANEFEISIKSKPEFQDNLILFLHNMTSYEVPQILFKKYYSDSEYHNWLSKTI